ncbi:MAG: mannonate dehydratase [Bacteroidetes bacterium]|nr:mannonate dehydratase [Bacteroidota bacterium]MDA1121927.1 mannonate dehydratase [Bacteroidota bacterium]
MKKNIQLFNSNSSRRKFITTVASAVAGTAAFPGISLANSNPIKSMVEPLIGDLKLSMPAGDLSDERLGFIRDMGVEYAQLSAAPGAPTYSPEGRVVQRQNSTDFPNGPWTISDIRRIKDRVESFDLKLGYLMMHDFRNAILGRPGRDQDIENVIKSIRVAGEVGIPILEYNWYALRAMGGYYKIPGRKGIEYAAFDNDRCKDLPVLPDVGEHSAEELWERFEYFLKAVVPVAEEVGVKLSVHPNDPPPPVFRGCAQILGSIEGLKRVIKIVPSPANGITWHTGCMTEMGANAVELIPHFMKNDQINHIHFRNVIVDIPRLKYTEVFIDEGQADMKAAIQALRDNGYPRLLYPDHVPNMDSDVQGSKVGWAYAVGYIKALMKS